MHTCACAWRVSFFECLFHSLLYYTISGGSLLAQSMKQNKNMQFTLVHLDLSSNPLGPDPQGSLAFIQEPQTIATLNLSKCSLNFEFVLPVLIRGCQQHLRDLNLSHNFGKGKRGIHSPNVAAGFQQFLSTSISIYTVNIAGCKLTSDIMTYVFRCVCVCVSPICLGFLAVI